MSSLSHANNVARKISIISGKKTYLIRNNYNRDVTVWHGGKKRSFGTNQSAEAYLDKLYVAYRNLM